MPDEKSLVKEALVLLRTRSEKSLEIARQAISEEQIKHKALADALQYFADESFPHVMHPGLLSVYCEAVGGNPDDTISVGAAMTLLVAAADIHDDIVDESAVKSAKPTVLGKFGKDVAVLAGDAFLITGLYLLHEATASLHETKRNTILKLIKKAFFDLSSAEADEAKLRGNVNLSGQEYLELLKRRTAVSEATAKIGAVLGNATLTEIETLGEIGVSAGLLSTLRDEFIDVYEPNELTNRFTNEILPLPILNVFQDPGKKELIIEQFTDGKLAKEKAEKILNIVLEAKETEELKNYMQLLIQKSLRSVSQLRGAEKSLSLLLRSTVEDLL
jgi:geranylgeranyl pyrophosphate synthase